MKRSILSGACFGLLFAVLPLILCTDAQATNWTVSMDGDRFDPDSLVVSLGDSVTWVNDDEEPHTSTSGVECTPDGDWDSGTLLPGETFTYVTDEEGTIPYYCTFHCDEGMVGVLVVTEPSPAEERTWGKVKALYRVASR